MYMITFEYEDGDLFVEPEVFDTKNEAITWARRSYYGKLPKGISIVLYRCTVEDVLFQAETGE